MSPTKLTPNQRREFPALKVCPGCEQPKPFSAYTKHRHKPNGIDHFCRECRRERARAYDSTPEAQAKAYFRYIKRTYGITRAKYEAMEALQQERCVICQRIPREAFSNGAIWHQRLHIDHCHKHGTRVRGLLCYNCNIGLGSFADNPTRLKAAIDYLEKHG